MRDNNESSKRFGQALSKAMEARGMKKNALAVKLEISYEHVRKMVSGEGYPTNIRLKEICSVLDLNYEEMERLVNQDRVEGKYGLTFLQSMGKDPRAEALKQAGLNMLNKNQLNEVMNTVKKLYKGNRKTGS